MNDINCKMTNPNRAAVRAMIEKGFAPASAKTIYRLVQAYEDGHPPVGELWNGMGAPRKHQIDHALEAAATIAAAAPKPVGIPMPEDLTEVTLIKRVEEQRVDECYDVSEEILEKSNKKKISTSKTSKKKSPAMRAAILPPKQSAIELPTTKPSPKPKEGKTALDVAINFPLPNPQVGGTYTKSEAVDIASQ